MYVSQKITNHGLQWRGDSSSLLGGEERTLYTRRVHGQPDRLRHKRTIVFKKDVTSSAEKSGEITKDNKELTVFRNWLKTGLTHRRVVVERQHSRGGNLPHHRMQRWSGRGHPDNHNVATGNMGGEPQSQENNKNR